MTLSSSSDHGHSKPESTLGLHRGAIDQTTITTKPPSKVMKHVNTILQEMGVQIQEESAFHYRCIRPSRRASDTSSMNLDHDQGVDVSPLIFYYSGVAGERGNLGNLSIQTLSQIQPHLEPEISPCQSIVEESSTTVLYGGPSEDMGDEVRFSVELTRLEGLNDTYSLDIRRLKGNLRSYKFIYDTIRK